MSLNMLEKASLFAGSNQVSTGVNKKIYIYILSAIIYIYDITKLYNWRSLNSKP